MFPALDRPAFSGSLPFGLIYWLQRVRFAIYNRRMVAYAAHKADLLVRTTYSDEKLHSRFRATVRAIPSGSRILDVACGAGTLAVALRNKGCTVTGFDLAPAAIALARSKGIQAFQADADAFDTDPSVRDMLFADLDVIVFSKCLMYLRRKNEFLPLLRAPRILAIQTDPLRWKTRFRRWRGDYDPPENPYITAEGETIDEHTFSGLRKWGESYGYRTRVIFGGFFGTRDAVIELLRR